MICVTGAESRFAEAAARVCALPDAPLHELRLDLMDSIPEPLALPPCRGLVVTLRDRSEGGHHQGSVEQKARLLLAALAAGARYVDLEASAPDGLWRQLSTAFGSERLVASLHRFEAGSVDASDLAPLLGRLASRPAGVLKLAVAVGDVCELGPLRALRVTDGRPLVRLGMGLAGQAGRVAHRAMGSPWTYVVAPSAGPTAPGQPSWSDLARFGKGTPPRLLALLGGWQVQGSPGPRVYTRLAKEEGLPFFYVAAPTADPLRALSLLVELGLEGASVTIPHKVAVLGAARPEGFAARAGAVNTLVPRVGRPGPGPAVPVPRGSAGAKGEPAWEGYNTDGEGVLGALAPALAAGPRRVVVLGTGGAARSAALALLEAGHGVTVLGRSGSAARAVAAQIGHGARGDELSALPSTTFEILVNATPVGAVGDEAPVPLARSWLGVTALDMVMSPRETALLGAVSRGGGRAVPGLDMWVHQGAAQWRLLTGQAVSPERLRGLAEAPDPWAAQGCR